MDNKKRMMFVLDEDYYFIMIKVLIILNQLECYKKKFIDYRKLAFIIAFIKEDRDLDLYKRSIKGYDELNILERERLVNIFYRGKMDQPVIKRELFFLEKKKLISLEKNVKFNCIDVVLIKNKDLNKILSSDKFNNDIEKVNKIYKELNRVTSIKYDTFIERVFGNSEVSRWGC